MYVYVTFFFLLQLLRPYDYNCPRLFEVLEKSKQEPEYVNAAKKYKVRLGTCVVVLMFCLRWMTLFSSPGAMQLAIYVASMLTACHQCKSDDLSFLQ